MTKCFRPSPVDRNGWQSEKRLSTAAHTSHTVNLHCYPLPKWHQGAHCGKFWFIQCLKGYSWYFFGFTTKLFSVAPDSWSWSHWSVRCWGTNASLSSPSSHYIAALLGSKWGQQKKMGKWWPLLVHCWMCNLEHVFCHLGANDRGVDVFVLEMLIFRVVFSHFLGFRFPFRLFSTRFYLFQGFSISICEISSAKIQVLILFCFLSALLS